MLLPCPFSQAIPLQSCTMLVTSSQLSSLPVTLGSPNCMEVPSPHHTLACATLPPNTGRVQPSEKTPLPNDTFPDHPVKVRAKQTPLQQRLGLHCAKSLPRSATSPLEPPNSTLGWLSVGVYPLQKQGQGISPSYLPFSSSPKSCSTIAGVGMRIQIFVQCSVHPQVD